MRIGVTQRVVFDDRVKERRDVLDQNWTVLLNALGITPVPIPNRLNDVHSYLESVGVNGILLTGGNNIGYRPGRRIPCLNIENDDVAYERDETEISVMEYVIAKSLPLLGVCRGLQLINIFFGGDITRVDPRLHVACEHSVKRSNLLWSDVYPEHFIVNSFHNHGIGSGNISKDLIAVAMCGNEVEAVQHKNLSIYGIMWHPERYTPSATKDIQLIKNIFLKKWKA